MKISTATIATLVYLPLAACITNPREEFRSAYEDMMIGKAYSKTIATWPEQKEIVAKSEGSGMTVRVPIKNDCNVFYEISHDIVIRAWDDRGSGCWKVN